MLPQRSHVQLRHQAAKSINQYFFKKNLEKKAHGGGAFITGLSTLTGPTTFFKRRARLSWVLDRQGPHSSWVSPHPGEKARAEPQNPVLPGPLLPVKPK